MPELFGNWAFGHVHSNVPSLVVVLEYENALVYSVNASVVPVVSADSSVQN